MYRTLLIIALVIVAVSIPAAATGSSQAPNVTLTGVVGPAATISLEERRRLGRAGTSTRGRTTSRSPTTRSSTTSTLSGPAWSRPRTSRATGPVSWTVTFTDGTYRFVCDPHAASMRGTFTVGNVPPPPPPPGKLSGKVTARTITLNTSAGSRVRSIVENTYRVTVTDASKKQNFHLTGPGVNKKTGVAARTKATWTVRLQPGKYTYRSDKNRRLRRTFTVTARP